VRGAAALQVRRLQLQKRALESELEKREELVSL
jgi:hypothetical protein